MSTLIKIALLAAQSAVAAAQSAPAPGLASPGELSGLPFGRSAQQIESLVAADWIPTGCSREHLYVPADADRRAALAGVTLARPGLLYRFVDDSLYAVEAEFPPGGGSFARLRHHLVRQHGEPSVTESWLGAPHDTYVYRRRMRMAGWYGINGAQSIWLTSADDGGRIVVTDNAIAGWAMRRVGEHCVADRGEQGAAVAAAAAATREQAQAGDPPER